MSKLLDRFRYFKQKGETFADGHGQVMRKLLLVSLQR